MPLTQQPKHPLKTLERISSCVDTLIKKHGSERTADYLETVVSAQKLSFDQTQSASISHIYAETIKAFRISPAMFKKGRSELCKKARASCFFFYKKYCRLSATSIMRLHTKMDLSRHKVDYAIQKLQDLIDFPAADKSHFGLHEQIDKKLCAMLSKK